MTGSRRVTYPAEAYDDYTSRFVAPYDAILVDRVIGEARRLPDARRLLDVGTGTAQLLLRLAALDRLAALQFTGVDFDPAMIACSQENVARSDTRGRIDLLVADVHELPFPDETFDLAISRSTIHHWSDPIVALQEIHRVLRPGGVAVIHDVRRDAPAAVLAMFNAARAEAKVPPSDIREKHTAEAVRDIVERAGLRRETSVRSAPTGVASLGFELRIRKRPVSERRNRKPFDRLPRN